MDSSVNPSNHDSPDRDDQVMLSILEEIEKNPETSQRNLADKLGIALGLVNSFVKRVVSRGYVKIKRLNSRNIQYLLTPKGFYEKSRLTYRFLRRSFHFLSLYRQKAYEVLAPCAEKGIREVMILGSGEEAELVYLAMRELGMKVIAIVDPQKSGERCLGYEIQSIDWLLNQEEISLLLVLHSTRLIPDYGTLLASIRQQIHVNHLLRIEI